MGLFPQSAPWAQSEGGPRFEKAMTPAPESTLAQRVSLPLFPRLLASLSFALLPSLYCEAMSVLSGPSAPVGPWLGVSIPRAGSPPVAVKCLLPSWLQGSGGLVSRDMPPSSGLAPLQRQQALMPGGEPCLDPSTPRLCCPRSGGRSESSG